VQAIDIVETIASGDGLSETYMTAMSHRLNEGHEGATIIARSSSR